MYFEDFYEGCYKDTANRALPQLKQVNPPTNRTPKIVKIDQCNEEAKKRNHAYFGLQDWKSCADGTCSYQKGTTVFTPAYYEPSKNTGQCWSGPTTNLNYYKRHGTANNCVKGSDNYYVGGGWSNAIYETS